MSDANERNEPRAFKWPADNSIGITKDSRGLGYTHLTQALDRVYRDWWWSVVKDDLIERVVRV